MKFEEVIPPTIYRIELNEKEYLILKILLNETGFQRDEKVKAQRSNWEDHLTEEEALEIAAEVGSTIWQI